MSEDKVLLNYLAVEDSTHSMSVNAKNARIAKITLNKPQALHALDLEMVRLLFRYLEQCKQDESVVAIFLDSEGDKAFCAGGDIVSMYKAMAETKSTQKEEATLPVFLAEFFAEEYRLDYAIHVYPKPIICWGHGIIMGGGLGVFSGASHKIVTQKARIAMPEITIGLFPDVGASYFLNQMPAGVGKFLGLTATSINAKDCINIGLSHYFISQDNKSAFIDKLCSISEFTKNAISSLCNEFSKTTENMELFASLEGTLTPFATSLSTIDELHDLSDFAHHLQKISDDFPDNKVLAKAKQAFLHGSPITAHLVNKQLQLSKNYGLSECFQMELSMAYQCSLLGEFQEGVRALLIDKDNKPNWRYTTFKEVPKNIVDEHFTFFARKNLPHPLSDLETSLGEYNA